MHLRDVRQRSEIKDWQGGQNNEKFIWSQFIVHAHQHVRRLCTPRFSCSLYQLATCRWSFCGATDDYIFHVQEVGCLPLLMGPPEEEIVAECRAPAVEFLPRECRGILLPTLKRSAIQRRGHFVSGSGAFLCTSLSATVFQSAVTVVTGSLWAVHRALKRGRIEVSAGIASHCMHARKGFLHVLNLHTQIQQPCWAGTWTRAKGGLSILAWC